MIWIINVSNTINHPARESPSILRFSRQSYLGVLDRIVFTDAA
ncbi:MAG: hypothetical protein ACD_15C00081G0001, partial [uncultured bacterium]